MPVSSFEIAAVHAPPALARGVPIRQSARSGPDWHRRLALLAKRGIDVVGALAGLLLFAPLLVVLAALIRLESPGPALFSQVRWGRDCRPIRIFKLRTMRHDCGDPSGLRQTVRHDPRITPLGAILRRWNLDELPQLFNVLKGEMSLVGPRCHVIGMHAAGMPYEQLTPHYHRRHQMRPGLTGLAQMRGLRGPTDRAARARARIACDIHYIEHFTLWLDVKILALTLVGEVLRPRGF